MGKVMGVLGWPGEVGVAVNWTLRRVLRRGGAAVAGVAGLRVRWFRWLYVATPGSASAPTARLAQPDQRAGQIFGAGLTRPGSRRLTHQNEVCALICR